MKTAILFGVPNSDRYSYLNYKRPLSEIPKGKLQQIVLNVQNKYCSTDVVILNTNLQELGIELP